MSKYCLCCGKRIDENTPHMWHKECIKKFFGTYNFPDVSLLEEELDKIAIEDIKNNFSVTGVQKKLSLGLSKDIKTKRITFTSLDPRYILKTPDSEIPFITESEQLVMLLANETGLKTVKHALIKTDKNGYIYISKRLDRKEERKLPMEDFCQLSNKLTEYKYNGSYERCIKDVIDKYSSNKSLDTIQFFRVIYFSYLVGNTDMHLKNFSLIDEGNGYRLTPIYDLVSAYILVGQDEMALSLNGKRKHLTKNDFFNFALNISLAKELATRLMKEINKKLERSYETLIDISLISEEIKKRMKELIKTRLSEFIF